MAYTNAWTVAAPVSGDAANQIWQFIQNVRQDMQDRLVGKFFQNMTDDPLKFSTAYLNKINYGDVVWLQGYNNAAVGKNYLQGFPMGRIITRVRVLVNQGASDTFRAVLAIKNIAIGTPGSSDTTIWTSSTTSVGSGYKLIDSGVGAPFPYTVPITTDPYCIPHVDVNQMAGSSGNVHAIIISHSPSVF